MKKKKHSIFQFAGLALLIGLLIVFVIGLRDQGKALEIGDEAMDFELEDLEGNVHRFSDYKGNIVVLNFFTTWCESCEEEAPMLIDFQEEFKDDVVSFTIVKADSRRSVEKYIERTGYEMPYLFDFDTSVSDDYGVIGQPETTIIDRDGIIRNHFVGPVSRDVLALEVDKLK